ncbi:MAG: glycosyltransferase [Rhodothermia bacterium]|nr:glycosyltransferase [Rhodothermia bacterium]
MPIDDQLRRRVLARPTISAAPKHIFQRVSVDDLSLSRLTDESLKKPPTGSSRIVESYPTIGVSGKYFSEGSDKFLLRGVTYGPFRPAADGSEYPCCSRIADDFAKMVQCGINTIRTYTVPPERMIVAAENVGLRMLVGLPWEQHIAFLDSYKSERAILQRLRLAVRTCDQSSSVVGFAIGNEIPSSIVRWYGPKRIARFLNEAYNAVKMERPESLVTYVNYPTTEYLQAHLTFVDFVSFNVYLESPHSYRSYVTRLQTLAGDKPLILAEIGLDSRRNGLERQAESLGWQIRTTFERGGAGAFVFSWTDEWFRGGSEIHDWDFGLTDRRGNSKPSLESVAAIFERIPVSERVPRPKMSVVICTYNGGGTIARALDAVQRLDYPDFEVIVVDDGSTDETAKIVTGFDVRLIRTANMGLSSARNTGWQAATGEIVAYLDDDAYPDCHWLSYLAEAFGSGNFAAVGGPNLLPPDSTDVQHAVNACPGNPIHVLLSDDVAEHIPGCNMAIRRDALSQLGGFDSQFRIAGDDVDLCWRLLKADLKIGFHPGAAVFHSRRGSIRAFLKQQFNYGKAEALLERKWPRKYNRLGHPRWAGRIYTAGLPFPRPFTRSRVYYGVWGSHPFQIEESRDVSIFASVQTTPEWYLLVIVLTGLTACGILWKPLFLAAPLLCASVGALVTRALVNTRGLRVAERRASIGVRLRAMYLHLIQPVARLLGRVRLGLTPWRPRFDWNWQMPQIEHKKIWSERWRPIDQWIAAVETAADSRGIPVHKCGPYSRCDLVALGGLFGMVRVRAAVEEHGNGRQLVHFKVVPHPTGSAIIVGASSALLLSLSIVFSSTSATILFGCALGAATLLALRDCVAALATMRDSVGDVSSEFEMSVPVD